MCLGVKVGTNHLHFFYSKDKKEELTKESVSNWIDRRSRFNWTSFDEYAETEVLINYVTLNYINYVLSECYCPAYQKNNICMHIIGIAARKRL